jgi:hypothetical protein
MFEIITPYGQHLTSETYLVNFKGQLCRRANTKTAYGFDNGWKFLGIEHVKRNEFIPFERIKNWTTEQFKSFEWCYKNGNPQWTVRDLDHGSTRTWGNTKHHGIKYMRRRRIEP